MHLNTIMPHLRCRVRRSFITNGEAPREEYDECEIVGAQSNIHRPIQFHVLLKTGAIFANLPIHALACERKSGTAAVHTGYGQAPTVQQMWDCPTHTMTCTVYPRLVGLRCRMQTLEGIIRGEYVCSFDWCHADVANPLGHPLDIPDERKCAHFIAGDDGRFFALPNNRIWWEDPSWVTEPEPNPVPYRAITKSYRCEQGFFVEDTLSTGYDTLVSRNGDIAPLWPGFPATGPSTEPTEHHTTAVETPANGEDGSDVPSKPTYRLTKESFDEMPAIFYTAAMNESLSSLPSVWKSPHPLDEGYDIGVKRSNGIDWYDAVIDPHADDLPF